MKYCVYIMANDRPTLYAGVTNNLVRRVSEHLNNLNPQSFTGLDIGFINWFTLKHSILPEVLLLEKKQIKNLSGSEKLNLIESVNPTFKNLFDELVGRIPGKPE